MGIEVHLKEQNEELQIKVDNNSIRKVVEALNESVENNIIEILNAYVKYNLDGFIEETDRVIKMNKIREE